MRENEAVVKVKLQFLAPRAGITEVAKRQSSARTFAMMTLHSNGGALTGIKLCPPDYTTSPQHTVVRGHSGPSFSHKRCPRDEPYLKHIEP